MGYRCFQFWFGVRLLLACLAHFNWFTAFFQLKCVYFTMWKSYDLLWFWMHLVLCICFPPLRPENFLLVWITLITEKWRNPNQTFKEIYNRKYNQKLTRYTKSERRLKQMEKEDEADAQDSESENGLSVIEENPNVPTALYPSIDKSGAPKVQRPIRLEKDSSADQALLEAGKNNGDDDRKSNTSSSAGRLLGRVVPNVLKRKLNLGEVATDKHSPDEEKDASGRIKLKKIIPNMFQRSASNDPEEEEARKRAKQLKKEERERQKQVRQERKAELRRLAAIELRRRIIAESIDLMLQCLRSFTSFAILVGNIRRHFLPRQWLPQSQDAFNNPDLLMLFTITITLDVMLFWLTMFLTYYRQCRLCCRMGICKFWMWLAILIALGFGAMYTPMHYVHQQLDYTWCDFEPGSDIAQYLDG